MLELNDLNCSKLRIGSLKTRVDRGLNLFVGSLEYFLQLTSDHLCVGFAE